MIHVLWAASLGLVFHIRSLTTQNHCPNSIPSTSNWIQVERYVDSSEIQDFFWKKKRGNPRVWWSSTLGGGVSTIFLFSPRKVGGRWPNLTRICFTPRRGRWTPFDAHIFQMGWLKPPTMNSISNCQSMTKVNHQQLRPWWLGNPTVLVLRSQVFGAGYRNQ